ncbi:MAG TPA: hypothetical protein QGF58_16225 [Myxococcota bacterium]|nr:hypothetical protein [Myxococcota bacterium]
MTVLTEQQADVLRDPTGTKRVADCEALETRDLIRRIRRPGDTGAMPESQLWRVYVELSRRGEPDAASLFLRSLRNLHRRRAMGTGQLSHVDPDPWEHRMADDPYVGELWKAYKRCISQQRTGPASQLLRDLEAQLVS